MLTQKKRTTEELLKRMSENNKKAKIQKLESDDQGRFLLDPNNKQHRAWYDNDNEYENTEEDK